MPEYESELTDLERAAPRLAQATAWNTPVETNLWYAIKAIIRHLEEQPVPQSAETLESRMRQIACEEIARTVWAQRETTSSLRATEPRGDGQGGSSTLSKTWQFAKVAPFGALQITATATSRDFSSPPTVGEALSALLVDLSTPLVPMTLESLSQSGPAPSSPQGDQAVGRSASGQEDGQSHDYNPQPEAKEDEWLTADEFVYIVQGLGPVRTKEIADLKAQLRAAKAEAEENKAKAELADQVAEGAKWMMANKWSEGAFWTGPRWAEWLADYDRLSTKEAEHDG